MKFRPLHDRVLIQALEGEEKTAGGVIIPDTAKEKPQEGKVVAVGPGGRDETGKVQALDVKVGDRQCVAHIVGQPRSGQIDHDMTGIFRGTFFVETA